MEGPDKQTDVELDVEVSDRGLSMKAKGAGTICLLALSICGIIFLGYLAATTDSTMLFLPILFLLFIAYHLINILHALFKTGLLITLPWD